MNFFTTYGHREHRVGKVPPRRTGVIVVVVIVVVMVVGCALSGCQLRVVGLSSW
jgi:hypothetical protein